jgi:hypothetical protein
MICTGRHAARSPYAYCELHYFAAFPRAWKLHGACAPTGNRARTKAAQIRAFCDAFANKHRTGGKSAPNYVMLINLSLRLVSF